MTYRLTVYSNEIELSDGTRADSFPVMGHKDYRIQFFLAKCRAFGHQISTIYKQEEKK